MKKMLCIVFSVIVIVSSLAISTFADDKNTSEPTTVAVEKINDTSITVKKIAKDKKKKRASEKKDNKKKKEKTSKETTTQSVTKVTVANDNFDENAFYEDFVETADEREEIQKELKQKRKQIKQINKKINETIAEIDVTEFKYNKLLEDFKSLQRSLYVSGGAVTSLELLLRAHGIEDYFIKLEMQKAVSRETEEFMKELESTKNLLSQKEELLKKEKEQLLLEKANLDAGMRALKAIDGMSKGDGVLITPEEILKMALENKMPIEDVEKLGQLSYPTKYRRISAGYPNYSSGRFHGGIDFPCPVKTEVHAAADGVVILAREIEYSYGHYILLDHGNGLSTLYAHNTILLVKPGDTVVRGQIIALSGSTGNSTGPHCHFEVRVNGDRVNPEDYLVDEEEDNIEETSAAPTENYVKPGENVVISY